MPHHAAHFGIPLSASPINHAIHPTGRYTAHDQRRKERSSSHRIIDGVIVFSLNVTTSEYGIYYESNNATGILQIALKPDLVALVSYSELPSPFLKVSIVSVRLGNRCRTR